MHHLVFLGVDGKTKVLAIKMKRKGPYFFASQTRLKH